MKKIALLLLLGISLTANAQRCCYRGPYFHGGPVGCCVSGWVAPAIVGGVIGYELAQPRTVIVEQQPVIVQNPVVQAPPVGYHWQEMIDPATNTKRVVLVPN
jgi:hypothetical protein